MRRLITLKIAPMLLTLIDLTETVVSVVLFGTVKNISDNSDVDYVIAV